MTDITTRNLFRLIRSGAFNTDEQVEPMSASKWQHLYLLAVAGNVTQTVFAGIERLKGQFFMRLTDKQWQQWRQAVASPTPSSAPDNSAAGGDKFLRPDQLTNPVLNRKLQHILDDEHTEADTREMLLRIIGIARSLLNSGISLRQMVELGQMLRDRSRSTDYVQLNKWIKELKLLSIAQLEGELLVSMFLFSREEIGFMPTGKDLKDVSRVRDELLQLTSRQTGEFYFSQEQGEVFVHGTGSSAMIDHVRRSAQYFSYYPSETITNFFASFAHSLSHIEE